MTKRLIACTLLTTLAVLVMQLHLSAQGMQAMGSDDRDTNSVMEEKLVMIAMARPSYDETVRDRNNARHELSLAKNAWLNLLAITLQFNETDFQKVPAGQPQYVYPKYFFGVTIPVGILFSRSSEIRIARENQYIAQDKQEEAARAIRAAVIGRYRAYVVYQEEIRLQNDVINDERVAFQSAKKDFKDGKITLDIYNVASRAYEGELTRKLTLVLASDAAKTDLEQALGMRLEDAMKR